MVNVELSDKILELRKRSCLSREDFCSKFKFEPAELRFWESRIKAPMYCIPVMVEILLEFERKYGDIEAPFKHPTTSAAVRDFKKRSGLTKLQFCQKFCISSYTFQTWMSGKHEPQKCVIHMLNKIFLYEDKTGISIPKPIWAMSYQVKN